MANTKPTAKRTKKTKPWPPQGVHAVNPIEHNRTNAEDLAVAQLKKDNERAERLRRTDHGKPGTFSPKNNEKYA